MEPKNSHFDGAFVCNKQTPGCCGWKVENCISRFCQLKKISTFFFFLNGIVGWLNCGRNSFSNDNDCNNDLVDNINDNNDFW